MSESIYVTADYLDNNPSWHEEDGPYKARVVHDLIKRSGISFTQIADVGCGSGKVTELLAQMLPGSKVQGYDISPNLTDMWARRDGVRFNLTDFSSADIHVDLAICLDVFEHVEDYYGFIRKVAERSDYVIFNIPLDMCVVKAIGPGIKRARRTVGHLHYFNDYTALETLKDCGLDVVEQTLTTTLFTAWPQNPYQWLLAAPRMAAAAFGKRFAARMLGGYSLAVLVRSKTDSRSAG